MNKKSFLEWVLSNKNGKINGYSNYYWNGCTCLSIAKYIEKVIENKTFWKGIRHLHSNDVISKYELACMINEIYDLNINIIKFKLDTTINKTLSTIYQNNI